MTSVLDNRQQTWERAKSLQTEACDARREGALGARAARRVLVLTGAFPSRVMPNYGVFVKERIRAVANLPGFEVRVIAPVPYCPPVKRLGKWYVWSQFPREEMVEGIQVLRPRYLLPPKVGHYVEANLMYGAVARALARLRRDWDFDLIDAHWAHPAGVVAARLGARLGKPVLITGRGADMCVLPAAPVIGRQIRQALGRASHCIAVSSEIGDRMRALGASAERVTVIPNGVDTEQFRPIPQAEARRRLGLPPGAKIILSVGDRFENKGFHLLIDALPRIRAEHPSAMVVIVGGAPRFGADFTPELEQRIRAHGLQDQVRMAGARPHDELVWWYNAADVFTLLSAREGSPNVLLEALACGIPAVTTPVGGMPEMLADPRLGVVLPERTTDAIASGIAGTLHRAWDTAAIRRTRESGSWRATAAAVAGVVERVLAREGQCGGTIERAVNPERPMNIPSDRESSSTPEVRHRSQAPVHVIGHGRSGTSIFIRLLREYLQIAFGTESQFIVRYHERLDDYGDLSLESNRRRLVEHICGERWFQRCRHRFGFTTTADAILADVAQPTYRGILDATFAQLAKHMGTPRWGDKTPEYLQHLPVLYGLYPDAKYIHVVRDGRDVALSGFETSFGEKNVFTAATDWTRTMHQIWSFSLSVRSDKLLEVRYEDLLARPVEQFERVIRFLEIDDGDGRLLDYISQRAPADLKQDNVDKWRTRMTPRQVARFDRIAWDCLQHYGYETTVDRPAAPSVVSSWFWECDNKVRKLLRSDYLSDNVYKARLRIRELLTARLPG